jgi:hypothetical protein
MTPSGSAPKAASPKPLGRRTNSAPGATVVDVVLDVVVDVVEVLVDVEGAVVTGIVVDVVADDTDVVVPSTTDDDVEPLSVVAGSSSLQLVAASAIRMRGRRRIDFTREVWHAICRLPDQRVCLVATFNKL